MKRKLEDFDSTTQVSDVGPYQKSDVGQGIFTGPSMYFPVAPIGGYDACVEEAKRMGMDDAQADFYCRSVKG